MNGSQGTKDRHLRIIPVPPEVCIGDPGVISLDRRCVKSLDLLPGECCRLVARTGIGWVTMAGDPIDHVLVPSAILQFIGPGRMVIEAAGEDNLQFEIEIGAAQ